MDIGSDIQDYACFYIFLVEKMALLNNFASWYFHLESEQA